MEKLNSISINGKSFKLTDSAYSLLKDYDRFVRKNVSSAEKILEIEVQMSVLLETGMQEPEQIIQVRDIEEAIKLIGENEKINFKRNSSKKFKSESTKSKFSKQGNLTRNSNSRVIGGVCAGIAKYLNVDPVVVRIIFILITVVFRFFLIVYLILWIFIPDETKKISARK